MQARLCWQNNRTQHVTDDSGNPMRRKKRERETRNDSRSGRAVGSQATGKRIILSVLNPITVTPLPSTSTTSYDATVQVIPSTSEKTGEAAPKHYVLPACPARPGRRKMRKHRKRNKKYESPAIRHARHAALSRVLPYAP